MQADKLTTTSEMENIKKSILRYTANKLDIAQAIVRRRGHSSRRNVVLFSVFLS